jgi:hypothetical protein
MDSVKPIEGVSYA